MALTNSQYDSIMHYYDSTRSENHRIHTERVDYVYKNVEGYRELDESVVSVSLDLAKRRISGDESATVAELKKLLGELKSMKASLLEGAGLPKDYLDEIYTCKDCKDTGYIDGVKCHCMLNKEIEILYDQSNICDFLAHNNFSTLSHDFHKGEHLERFMKAEEICHDMVNSFGEKPSNLLLFGTVGTGKSFLSGCVARELILKGYSVIYYSSINLFEYLAREVFGKNDKDDLYNQTDCLYNCDLLIIDDLGTELSNSFVASQLFSCINERALRKKSTIISTNLSLEEIRDRYSDRVFSRLISGYTVCKLTGPDIRTLQKQLAGGK